MTLTFRTADAADYPAIESLVIDAFEPITWQKQLDARFGPLAGHDWRSRWQSRLAKIFATQIVLLGEYNSRLAAVATGTLDAEATLGFIDVLAVSRQFQGQGFGREMLWAMIERLKQRGCRYVNLDCLTDNDAGNALYQSEGFVEVARHIRWFREI